jgi:hypothetical protein
MWPFSKIKKLEQENKMLKELICKYESPLSLDGPLSSDEWGKLSEEDRVHRIRKLDLVLTMKKTGRWDYQNNCAKFKA